MIYAITAYFVVSFATIIILNKSRKSFSRFPKLYLTEFGVEMSTISKHRLFVHNAKIIHVENIVYVKLGTQMFILQNVDNVFLCDEYLYFRGQGRVKIIFNTKKIFKYFDMKIASPVLEFENRKQKVIISILNDLFFWERNKELLNYIRFLRYVLNIKITKNALIVGKNKLNIPFSIEYISAGKRKRIKILSNYLLDKKSLI